MKHVFTILAVVILAASAFGQSTEKKITSDGVGLLKACHDGRSDGEFRDDFDTLSFGYCMGFIKALNQSLLIHDRVCENNVSIDQLIAVVTKYLHDHPEELNILASATSEVALRKAFPCRPTVSKKE